MSRKTSATNIPIVGLSKVDAVLSSVLLPTINDEENKTILKRKSISENHVDLETLEDRKLRKNEREKQRREEINDQYKGLCNVLKLNPKSEKYSVMAEAIKTILSLKAIVDQQAEENTNLKSQVSTQLSIINSLRRPSIPGVENHAFSKLSAERDDLESPKKKAARGGKK